MKRSTRSFVNKVLRSRKRLFADRYQDEVKRLKIISLAFIDTQVNNTCKLINHDLQKQSLNLGKSKKVKVNGIDEGKDAIELGELKELSLIDENRDRIKRFGIVYERKKKKVRVGLESGFDGKCVVKKWPVVFAVSCSCDDDNSSSVYRFSCFVSSVLRYLRMVKIFSWRRFYSFLSFEPDSSVYSLIGSRFLQNSTCNSSHGIFKASIGTLQRDPPLVKLVVAKKARSATKRIPRVSLFNNLSQRNESAHVESTLPVPGVREVVGYPEEDYVPFMLPESYISSKGDEVSRTLEKSYPVFDMDSDDEQWLKKLNDGGVSEDVFEKVIDAFERGIYCSPHDYSEAASAVGRCSELASKEVLEDVYSYWMTKRKKKRSALIRVFQCYKQKRVKRRSTNTVLRKKRSFRRRASQRFAVKQLDFKQAMLNDEKLLEESKAYIKMHETQEAAKRSEEASIVKRQKAQALMEAADLAIYKATMALRIAEALAASGSVEPVTGALFGCLVE
ncbi:hypothetical protein M8C21_016816 [Ambrosia artemisiifolia]|uniref:Enhancer of polycomb-like protein n=1 Tax=Ambrosia artemisiifolia TaxID=4212 RepID=A0AAD5D2P8_AMBAR|nr:hypothetical protein M8C21_016816 [Ambrosia artemisiifolia]